MRDRFRRSRQLLASLIAAAAACAVALVHAQTPPPASAAPSAQAEPLNVMTFNVRYATANDGENRWANRKAFLFDVVRDANADLIGLQEALDAQLAEIVAAAPIYGVVGVGRDDGKTRGEYAAILYRRDRFHVAEAGTFWFSDTPTVPASKSWGNNTTRICTWARFIDRGGRAFWHYNVHLDHESQPSRERSTAFLAERIAARRPADEPVIVTGDFNVGEANPAMSTLRPLLIDTFRVRYPEEKVVGTFSGFVSGTINGDKIDYILVLPGTEVLDAAIVRTARDGRYPSDHFPVTARIRFRVPGFQGSGF